MVRSLRRWHDLYRLGGGRSDALGSDAGRSGVVQAPRRQLFFERSRGAFCCAAAVSTQERMSLESKRSVQQQVCDMRTKWEPDG